MDDIAIARAMHLLSVLHWIGGLAFVTLVVLPAIAAHAEILYADDPEAAATLAEIRALVGTPDGADRRSAADAQPPSLPDSASPSSPSPPPHERNP